MQYDIGKYKLNEITCDNLERLLRTAASELERFTRKDNEIKRYEAQIVNLKQKMKEDQNKRWLLRGIGIAVITVPMLFQSFNALNEKVNSMNWNLYLILFVLLLGLLLYSLLCLGNAHRVKKLKKTVPVTLNKWETQRSNLEKELALMTGEFTALQFIPEKYSNEKALRTMLGYIQDYTASNWERCTDLYTEQIHRWKMEGIAERTLEQAEISTRLAAETRDAARSAAAGAWTAAASIWWR
jgi:hypothetical protein